MSVWSLPPLPDLDAEVLALLHQVPAGQVTTFGDLATALGDVRAARWIAQAVAEGMLRPADGPLHRIVRKSGELTGAVVDQARRLREEGCPFFDDGRVEVSAAGCRIAPITRPLGELSAWQNRMAAAPDPDKSLAIPQTIGGVDLSYVSPKNAVAAYVSVDVSTGDVRFTHTIHRPVRFPYIPGYLTFREAPVLLELLADVRRRERLDPVILVDGTGRLHPRRAGIAVAIGLLADCMTVGVAKSQLCGRVAMDRRVENCAVIEYGGHIVGAVLDGGSKRRTLFVSSGFGIDLESAVRCTRAVWREQRLPLPIFHADRLSREFARSSVPVTRK